MNTRDEYDEARQRMVADQLRARGIQSEKVLRAMLRVPREQFVPHNLVSRAYSDQALPIDCEQTISQPYIVALMTEALDLNGNERVLEIGTGSGYQTAILAELASEIFTIERHADLQQTAQTRLDRLGYSNIHFRIADGHDGWPDQAPFDRIIITAAAPHCPPALLDQLSPHGILVGPFGSPESQTIQAIRRHHGHEQSISLTPCRFVPLVKDNNETE